MAYKFATGSIYRGDIYHENDAEKNTYLDWSDNAFGVVVGGVANLVLSSSTVILNDGAADVDLIVKSPNESKALYLHSGNEVLHINHGESSFKTKIHSTNGEAITVNNSGVILNEDGAAANDFRVETDNNTHMFFVDAGNDRIGIGTASPSTVLHVSGDTSAINCIIEGSLSSSNTLYAGDLLIKGGPENVGQPQLWIQGHGSHEILFGDAGQAANITAVGHMHVLAQTGDTFIGAGNIGGCIAIESAAGNVGIGLGYYVDASARFQISGSDNSDMLLINSDSNDNILFVTGSGRVGIGTSSPGSTFEVSGSQAGNYTQAAGNFTFDETHYIVDYTGDGDATFTLPDVSGITGRVYHIISHNQSEEDVNLTVTGSGGQFQSPSFESGDQDSIRIGGNTPQSITVVSTGGNWFVLNDNRAQEH